MKDSVLLFSFAFYVDKESEIKQGSVLQLKGSKYGYFLYDVYGRKVGGRCNDCVAQNILQASEYEIVVGEYLADLKYRIDVFVNKKEQGIRRLNIDANTIAINVLDSVESIEARCAFAYSEFMGIRVGENHPRYTMLGGENVIVERDTATLVIGSNRAVIPEGVKIIGENAFGVCYFMKNVTLPSTLERIEDRAFHGCIGINEIVVPPNVKYIGKEAFSGCRSLKRVEFQGDNVELGTEVFSDCRLLREVTLPRHLEVIPDNTFEFCDSLEHIELPETLQQIQSHAFAFCKMLKQIEIPASVNNIYAKSFLDCDSLRTITVSKENKTYDSRDNCNAIIHTESNTLNAGFMTTKIPDSVTTIGPSAFCGMDKLTAITIPSSVKRIESKAFAHCMCLEKVEIAKGLTEIGEHAFDGCMSLTHIKLPQSLETIRQSAFESCCALEHVEMPAHKSDIDPTVFNQCPNLKEVVFKDVMK